MRKTLEVREAFVGSYCGNHGRSTVDITCPFCDTTQTAYVWSIRGGGKKCEGYNCDTMLTGTGRALKLFPELNDKQFSLLKDIRQLKRAEIGDTWSPNKRILKSLVNKGYVTHGKNQGDGYSLTELAEKYFNE